MPKELVSAVITTYKRKHNLLLEAINSVKQQTYPTIEIIVIDDNGIGTDYQIRNEKILSEYGVRYYANKINSGAQFSRNQGILHAKGEFIAFLDDDDLWEKHKIEEQMKLFTTDKVGMVFCDGYIFYGNDMKHLKKYQDFPIFNTVITTEMELYRDYIGSTTQALVKKECFAKVGLFDLDMPARQDYEMWIRISTEYEIIGVEKPLFYYRVHDNERITSSIVRQFIGMKNILHKYKKYYNKNSAAKAKVIMRLCRFSIDMKKYSQAIGYLFSAFLVNPKCTIQTIKNFQK